MVQKIWNHLKLFKKKKSNSQETLEFQELHCLPESPFLPGNSAWKPPWCPLLHMPSNTKFLQNQKHESITPPTKCCKRLWTFQSSPSKSTKANLVPLPSTYLPGLTFLLLLSPFHSEMLGNGVAERTASCWAHLDAPHRKQGLSWIPGIPITAQLITPGMEWG